ncbi:MAG: hypothetical protein ACI9QC_000639 [Oceanicoccus sp.]|jgi:hypothetical protein
MDLFKLFSPAYLFETTPGYNYAYNWPFLIFFILLFVASIKVHELLKNRPKAKLENPFFGGIPVIMRWFAVIGILFNFFRDQNIPFLGMRIWILLTFISMFAYAIFIWRRYELKFEESASKKTMNSFEDKYLPKAKKKKKSKKRK